MVHPPRLRPGPVVWLGFVLTLAVMAGVFHALRLRAGAGLDVNAPTAFLGVVMGVCAAIILSHRPGLVIGRIMMGFAVAWAADGALDAWYLLATTPGVAGADDPLPGAGISYWFVARAGAFLLTGIPALLVLYPDGRLLDGGWRVLGAATLLAAMLLPTVLLVMPADVLALVTPPGAVEDPDLLSLPIPASVGVPLLVVARAVTLAAVLPALALVVVRHHRSTGSNRRQLRWLLWACVVCAFLLVVTLLVPSGNLAGLALLVAVTVTSASVTIGVCWPDRFDVDGLVADTVAWGAVGAIVITLDLAVIALASRALGERLTEREGIIAALLLAVLLYAPLRSMVWTRVRRVLTGRRGDPYHVIAGLAQRLESRDSVADQLPALAAAIAGSFRLSYVGVEVVRSDGGRIGAHHGTRPARVTELPIAYSGQKVGQLILPVRGGLRSLLTREDQALLLDVVRQAAIAVRLATLSGDLQAARERLVLAREEDRRRIRRDLHDGLGPCLGGVGLRLAAAAGAVDADPERAKELIASSRIDLQEAVADVRRLVHGLRPPALDDLGLVAAIDQQADQLRMSGLAVQITAAGMDDLPAAVEVAAYRIVAESLTNVARHASAGRVAVELSRRDGEVHILVSDDGVGIAWDRTAGVGLLSVRERTAELGGRSSVTCPADGGTVVQAVLPLTGGAT